MKRFFIKLALFTALTWVVCFAVERLYDQRVPTMTFRKIFWLFHHQDQHFDYGFIGSSRTYNTIDISCLDSALNQSGINLGVGGMGHIDQYMVFEKFIRNGNQIDRLFIQVDAQGLNAPRHFSHAFHSHFYIPYLHTDPILSAHIREFTSPTRYLFWRYVPLAKYMEFNALYTPLAVFRRLPAHGGQGTKLIQGTIDNATFEDLINREQAPFTIDSTTVAYLDRLITLARQHGTEVILYTAPEYITRRDHLANRDEMIAEIEAIAARHEIDYWNLYDCELAADRSLFRDPTHLNNTGATAFARLLSRKM